MNSYTGVTSPKTVRCRLYAVLVQGVFDACARAFKIDRQRFRAFLNSPTVRKGVLSVLRGVARHGVTLPQRLAAPLLVVWNFTNMCNLRCEHCYQNAGSASPDELSLAEKLAAVRTLAEAGVAAIALSGGEPLMHPHCFSVVEEITRRGMYAAVATNGTLLTADTARRLHAAGVGYVEISLDSSRPRVHDIFRGVPGSWRRAVDGMRNCVEAGLFTVMATTVTRLNQSEVPDLIALAASLGVHRFMHFNFVPTGRGAEIAELDLSPLERETLLTTLHRSAREAEIEVLSTAPQYARVVLQQSGGHDVTPTHFYLGSNRGRDLDVLAEFIGGCGAGRLYCALQPNGDVTPCVFMPRWVVGNLRNVAFPAIWRTIETDEAYRCFRSRESLGGSCGTCEHRYVCGGCRARALGYFDDPMGPDVGCVRNRRYWRHLIASSGQEAMPVVPLPS